MMRSIVPDGARETTLARYIARAWPMLPGFVLRDALKKRDARVNGARAGAEAKVGPGDEIALYVGAKYEPEALNVLFCDGKLIAFVKPRGLPVDADAEGVGEDTARARLARLHADARLVHRLDAGTGGAMLAALDAQTEDALLRAFRERRVHKKYAALCAGPFSKKEETLSAYLIKDADGAKVRVTDAPRPGAKEIVTRYRVLEEFTADRIALANAEVEIPTGRTHQIRAHMAHVGHPLAGDDKYGDRQINRALDAREICLWCESIMLSGAPGLNAYEGQIFEAKRPEWKIKR